MRASAVAAARLWTAVAAARLWTAVAAARLGTVVAAVLLSTFAMAQGEGDPRAGRRLAGGICAACHGNDGIATLPEAPNLAGQNAAYVAQQLRHYRDGTRVHELMTIVSRELTDAQIADLAAWYAAIAIEATVPAR